MATFKLRKGITLGNLSAEYDSLLIDSFIDTGELATLADTNNPKFLLLGRTGSGKTGLILKIKSSLLAGEFSVIDPEELSMQYLHSNQIINSIYSFGIHLDIFYKFLWRHIVILELIKLRYPNERDPNILQRLFNSVFNNDNKKTENAAIKYLEEHGREYWVTADTHIKNFVTELETKFSATLGADLSVKFASANGKVDTLISKKEKVESEVKERLQKIVNDFQIATLNELVKLLEKNSFNDPQRRYYIFIDDLDKNWMPNQDLLDDLIKSLIETVKDINQRIKNIKIIVSLRTNIYYRIYKKSKINEPQREKWQDLIIDVKWTKEELINLVNKRLELIFKDQYTNISPTLLDILPTEKKNNKISCIDYILERTLFRPRDIISFFNTLITNLDGNLNKITWSKIEKSEIEYSKSRIDSLFDEWKDNYRGLSILFDLLSKIGPQFTIAEFTDELLYEILSKRECEECQWLKSLQTKFIENTNYHSMKAEILHILYLVGLIGVKNKTEHTYQYATDKPINLIFRGDEIIDSNIYNVHKMYCKGLNLNVQ